MYDAFISYSHAKDKPIAAALQSAIQTLGKPWWKVRSARVFRDDTSLSASPSLWPSIQMALEQSTWLILIASPDSAKSNWVQREVEFWLSAKGADTLLVALTEGNLIWDENRSTFFHASRTTPLPPILDGAFSTEPLWIDLRSHRSETPISFKSDKHLLAKCAHLAAPVRGIARDELLSEELTQQRRNLLWARGAATSLAALAATAIAMSVVATRSQKLAENQRDRAQRVLDQVIASSNQRVTVLRNQIVRESQSARVTTPVEKMEDEVRYKRATEGIAKANDLIENESVGPAERLLNEVLALLEAPPTGDKDIIPWKVARMNAYDLIATCEMRKMSDERANAALLQALAIGEKLAAEHPAQLSVAIALARVLRAQGDLQRKKKNFDLARSLYLKAKTTIEPALSGMVQEVAVLELAALQIREASALLESHRFADSDSLLESAIMSLQRPAETATPSLQREIELALAFYLMHLRLLQKGDPSTAAIWLLKDIELTQRRAGSASSTFRDQHALLVSYDALGRLKRSLHDLTSAAEAFRAAVRAADTLPLTGRVEWQRDRAAALEELGSTLLQLKQPGEALLAIRKSLSVRETLAATSAASAYWQRELENAYRRARTILIENDRNDEALETAEQELFAISLTADTDQAKVIRVGRALGTLCWTALLARSVKRADWACNEAYALVPELAFVRLNLAHTLLLTGKDNEARSLYAAIYRDTRQEKSKWRQSIVDDFAALSKKGLRTPLFEEILSSLVD